MNQYLDTSNLGIEILDANNQFVKLKGILKNEEVDDWSELQLESGRNIIATGDHPFITETGKTIVNDLIEGEHLFDNDDEGVLIKAIKKLDLIQDSYDVETESDTFICSGIKSHNCRSAINIDYSSHIYSKFNLGVVSLNLPYIALLSKGDPEKFWEELDKKMNLAFKAQTTRVKNLQNTPSDAAPILWKYGAYARLNSGETLDKILDKEHSTISLGYMGLHECVKYMTGKTHIDRTAMKFAKDILKYMNNKCKQWVKETNLGWGVYGTPAESLTYKFAKACVRDFGTVDGENKRDYITNSYHIHVTEPVNAFEKLAIESEFQDLSTGGAISYIETPNLQDNIPAVLSVLQYIYENIMYAELNCKSDYCYECGFDGEMGFFKSETDPEIFGWKCPECGNTDQTRLSVIRRTCGYLGENRNTAGWNKGRFAEITDRVLHL